MSKTGVLSVSDGISRIPNTHRLAVRNSSTPLKDATAFIANRGFNPGDTITVTGEEGSIPSGAVFFITNVF